MNFFEREAAHDNPQTLADLLEEFADALSTQRYLAEEEGTCDPRVDRRLEVLKELLAEQGVKVSW